MLLLAFRQDCIDPSANKNYLTLLQIWALVEIAIIEIFRGPYQQNMSKKAESAEDFYERLKRGNYSAAEEFSALDETHLSLLSNLLKENLTGFQIAAKVKFETFILETTIIS